MMFPPYLRKNHPCSYIYIRYDCLITSTITVYVTSSGHVASFINQVNRWNRLRKRSTVNKPFRMSRFEQPSTAVAALGVRVGQQPGPSPAPSMPSPSPRKGGPPPSPAPARPQHRPQDAPKRPPRRGPSALKRPRPTGRPQKAENTYTQRLLRTNTGANPTDHRMQRKRTPTTTSGPTQALNRPCAECKENIHIPRTLELHRHATTRPTAECTAYIHLLQTPCSDRRQPDRPQNASSLM